MKTREFTRNNAGEILGDDPFDRSGGMNAYVRAARIYAAPASAAAVAAGTAAPAAAAEEAGALLSPSPESDASHAPPVPALRPIVRADGSLNMAGLWDRGRHALKLRSGQEEGRKPWVESPVPPLQPDYKLFPVKRPRLTETRVERIARRFGLVPHDLEPEIDDFGRDAGYEAAVQRFFELIYRKWLRVETRGLEHVPSTGRTLLVSNHANWMVLDAAMIEVAVQTEHPARREVRALVDRFTTKIPGLNVFFARTGQVYGCPENALRLLQREEAVLVFPEGAKGAMKPFRERMRVGTFTRGFARIAILTGTPIVPVAVQGFEELHPVLFNLTGLAQRLGLPDLPITPTFPWLGLLGLVPPPVKCFIDFGKPISTADYPPEAAEDEEIVSRLAEKVRLIVQDLYEHLRAQRRSRLSD